METTKVLDLENDGLNMAEDGEYLYIRCKRAMYKYDLSDMSQTADNVIFKKDGKARSLSVSEKFVFLTDFCDLCILDKADLRIRDVLRLGTDLSTDLLRARFDSQKTYAAVRNGKMAVVDMNSKNFNIYEITDSSFWDYCLIGDYIYAGTVRGELIEIDKNTMRVSRKTELCKKKNIYSVMFNNGLLYMVSQDSTIKAVDIASFETVYTAKKAVGSMANILGILNGCLVVADTNKISLWDIPSLQHRDTFGFPTGSWSKGVILAGSILFGSDYQSVYRAFLNTSPC